MKSLSLSLYLSVHLINCVKCVRPKAYLYNLARKKTIQHVVSFFLMDEICSTFFRPKELFFGWKNGFSAEKLGNRSILTVSVRFLSFGRKKEIGTENYNQRISPSLTKLWRLRTPANTENLVSKMTPAFPKLNLLSIPIICFHFLYFYLILFIF